MRQFLTFELDGRRYGVGVEFVNSVLDPQAITPLPHADTIVTGLTNVRGNVVPVFDPSEILKRTKVDDEQTAVANQDNTAVAENTVGRNVNSPADDEEEGGIVIFETENGTLLPFIGLQADRIGKVVTLNEGELSPVPGFLPESAGRFFEGFCFVGGVRHSILDLKELTSRETLFAVEGGRRG
ncbi:MAG: chemotaxis protein CheW [Clostridia bacterium]|jgi:chemotaxis signal transduction protein|nr:chemotaxis protein CheW [Spirochaetia bacterium]